LSLVEVTIMLLVLMLLTGVLAPSIFDFVVDARWVKVKEDCEAIGISVARITRDVGPCLKFNASEKCTLRNRVDILFSDGPEVDRQSLGGGSSLTFENYAGNLNWDGDDTRGDSMEHQFVMNDSGYKTVGQLENLNRVGPAFGLGWRGAYLSGPIGPDPWGHRYLVNSVFLSVATDASDGYGQGQRNGGWDKDTFCISSGPNGIFDTGFIGSNYGTDRRADDFTYVIQGDTR
jgi:hypothetical protein